MGKEIYLKKSRRTYGAPLKEIKEGFGEHHGVSIVKEHLAPYYGIDYEYGNIGATTIDKDYGENGISLKELKRLYEILKEQG